MARSIGETGEIVEPINEPTFGPPEPSEPTPPPPPDPPAARGVHVPRWLMAAVAIVLVGALGYGLGALTQDDDSSSSASPATPQTPAGPNPPTAPPAPTTPGAAALSGIGVVQSDLPSTFSVALIPSGNQVSGTATLDLCNGTFPSESLRTARLQLVAADAQGNIPLSTEAVLYQNAAATKQAFDELTSVAAKCPSTPVRSPFSGTTVITKFDPAPDGAWPQVATVDRLAYSFTSTDPSSGNSSPLIAVYLKRGRVLLGLYFADPTGTIPTISGQRTIAGIVTVFANRIAQLPDSVVNG